MPSSECEGLRFKLCAVREEDGEGDRMLTGCNIHAKGAVGSMVGLRRTFVHSVSRFLS